MKMFTNYLAVLLAAFHADACEVRDPLIVLAGSNCATDDGKRVQYWLYNETGGTRICCPSEVDNTKPLKMLLPGWGGDKDVDYMQVIKDAYMKKNATRYNVVIVDFGMYANGETLLHYATAYCNVPVVAKSLANFICDQFENGMEAKDIHVIGHSLGAHVAGIAGRLVSTICNINIGRITGLDPAGPGFKWNRNRLDATSAEFVDVIHTNILGGGIALKSGNVDFYVNTAVVQPGCPNATTKVCDLIRNPALIFMIASCSHKRSCHLFAESILSNRFRCFFPEDVYMGEYCRSPPRFSRYLVFTGGSPPYGLSCNGPMD